MYELSLPEIDQISCDVRAQGITFSHLADELIDHICCDVEYEMQRGIPFTEAYSVVRQKMRSGRRLKEIQEETLFAVDTKYRNMKNTMKVSGIAGTILFGFASLFKIMHWPMAGVMMTLGALTLAFLFMPSALGVLWKESHSQKRLFLFISAFFAAMFFILGILFKVQHWPGAGVLITLAGVTAILLLVPSFLQSTIANPERKASQAVYITGAIAVMICLAGFFFKIMHWPLAGVLIALGLLVLFGVAFPWYVVTAYKNESFVRAEFIYLVVGSLAILIPAVLTVTNIQRSFDEGYFTSIARETAQYNYLAGTNDIFVAQNGDSANRSRLQELHAMTGKVISVINRVESEMIAIAEGENGVPLTGSPQAVQAREGNPVDYRSLSYPFNPAPFRELLAPGSSARKDIENALVEYRNYISETFPSGVSAFTDKLPDASVCLPEADGYETRVSLLTGLHSLTLMKNSVMTTENILLKTLVNSN
jgi:hypothetical protein